MLEYKYLWLVEKQIYVEKVFGTCPPGSRFLEFYVIDEKYICYENIQHIIQIIAFGGASPCNCIVRKG